MTETVTKAIQEYREQLKKDYAPNGMVALKDVWKYTRFDTIMDVIEDVNSNYLDDVADEDSLVLDNFVKKYGNLNPLADAIDGDDYIVPDWESVTDFHDYAEDVISTAKDLLK